MANERSEYTFVGFTKGKVGASASKDGYYSGAADDPEKIILRKKQHPVPMYAKAAWVDLPAGDGDFGCPQRLWNGSRGVSWLVGANFTR